MNKRTNLILILSFIILLFGSGYKLGEYRANQSKIERPAYNILNAENQNKVKNIDFSVFWDTWNKVEQKYVDKKKLDPKRMLYGAIKGMVASLNDPYTFFLTPEENKETKNDLDGKFEGIGAQLGLKNNRIVVIAPLKNSPAIRAGIEAGDIIVAIDDQSTKNITLPQAVSKIRGKKGTKVKLTFSRGDKEFEKTLIRDQIQVESVELTYEEKTVAHLKVNQFGDNTNSEWDRAVAEISDKYKSGEIKGVVLDLRDNPGGFLESSVYLASEFLPEGKLIVKQESTSGDNRDYMVERRGKLLDIPLVVLINQGSASASEILSGALRDYQRAVLIGAKSFGKGSVQEALDLQEGAGLHVTVAKWILPKGEWINGKGITPNVIIENKKDEQNTLTTETDLQFNRAVKEVLK